MTWAEKIFCLIVVPDILDQVQPGFNLYIGIKTTTCNKSYVMSKMGEMNNAQGTFAQAQGMYASVYKFPKP